MAALLIFLPDSWVYTGRSIERCFELEFNDFTRSVASAAIAMLQTGWFLQWATEPLLSLKL